MLKSNFLFYAIFTELEEGLSNYSAYILQLEMLAKPNDNIYSSNIVYRGLNYYPVVARNEISGNPYIFNYLYWISLDVATVL